MDNVLSDPSSWKNVTCADAAIPREVAAVQDCLLQKTAQNKPIYERRVVKRGGADFVSRVPAHPFRRRLRSIWPISDLSADDSGVHPATHPLSPRPRESFLPSVPAVYEALTDVT